MENVFFISMTLRMVSEMDLRNMASSSILVMTRLVFFPWMSMSGHHSCPSLGLIALWFVSLSYAS